MIFLALLVFTLGCAVGSFLNVLIDRSTRGESLLGRSYCDHCNAKLSSIDLIPIVSFVGFGRRCRYCHKPISSQYPIVEGVTGLLFLLSFYQLVQSGSFNIATLVYHFLLATVMVIVAVVDIKFSLIPTTFVYFASFVALFYNFFTLSTGEFFNHVLSAFGAALFFAVIVILTRGRGMGSGDIVLGFMIGMVLGVQNTIVAIFLAFALGAILSLLLIFVGRKRFGETIPFAPFLITGLLISMYFASPLVDWYLMLYL